MLHLNSGSRFCGAYETFWGGGGFTGPRGGGGSCELLWSLGATLRNHATVCPQRPDRRNEAHPTRPRPVPAPGGCNEVDDDAHGIDSPAFAVKDQGRPDCHLD